MTRPRWTLTVRSEMRNWAAICLLSELATTQRKTSSSRGVRLAARRRKFSSSACFSPELPVLIEGGVDGGEQVFGPERFGQEIRGAAFHGLDAHGNVCMAGEEHDGDADAASGQGGLQAKAAEVGHGDIQHQAARFVGGQFKEFPG